MNLYATFAQSPELEGTDGITLRYGDATIRVLRAGGTNQKYYEAWRRHATSAGEIVRVNPTDKEAILNLAKVYAESVIAGWNNVQDKEGKEIPFSKENVIKVLTDLPELFTDIREAANNAAMFRESIREAILGKSVPATNGE